MRFISVLITLLATLNYKTTAYFTSSSKIEWISVDPSHVVLAFQHPDGIEGNGDHYTYICRYVYSGGEYAGKLIWLQSEAPHCGYGYHGSEYKAYYFEVLSAPKGSLSWQEFDGTFPQNAIFAGNLAESTDRDSYVCRGWTDDKIRLVIGYYCPKTSKCYVVYYGEHALGEFEVLVKNHYGLVMNF